MRRGSASKKTLVASEQTRPDVVRKRTRWKARQAHVDRKRLVFIDETWVKTNMEPELSAGVGEIIEVAMAKKRKLRYQSAEEMLSDLEKVAENLEHVPKNPARTIFHPA